MLQTRFPIKTDELAAFCHRHGVAKLSVFGSVLRNDFDPSRSDLDVLVEFAAGSHKGLFKLVEMQGALSRILGREVDLTTPNSLSKYFRDDVLASAVVLYDTA
ncbi:MAG: nucleotidyltransferase family protein [Pirellulales bacterium]